MIEVDSFVLRNIVHFNKTKVPVRENNGFVVISGLNKDSRIAKDQNNGAGKSLLWSALPNAFYAAAPSSTLKNTKKDMLDSTKSEIDVRLIGNDGRKVRIVQKPSKWVIYEEDPETGKLKDTHTHRLSFQQAKIEQHFPITPDEFYAYTYLSSIQGQRLHFQVEKPAERLKFITSIFQLDSYDKLKKYFTTMLSKIKDEQTKFDVLESKLLSINTQLAKLDWSEASASEAKAAKKRFTSLKSERDDLAKKVTLLESLLKQIASLEKLIEKRDAILEDLPNKPISEIESVLLKKKKVLREYASHKKEMDTYVKTTSRYSDKLEELKAILAERDLNSAKKINKRLSVLKDSIEKLIDEVSEAQSHNSRVAKWEKIRDQFKQELTNLGFKSVKAVDMDSDFEDELAVCKSTVQLKRLLDSNTDSVCPTCHQDVDLDSIKSSVSKAAKRIKVLTALKEARQVAARFKDASKELKSLGSTVDVKDLQAKLITQKAEVEEHRKTLRVIEKIHDLTSELELVEEPQAFDKKIPNASEDELDEALIACREASKLEHSIANMVEGSEDLAAAQEDTATYKRKAKKKFQKLYAKLETLDKEYKSLSKTVSTYDLKLGEYRILSKQKLELDSDVEAIKPLLAKRDLYKTLEKAYSSKGLKVHRANEITRLIEDTLNQYSNLIFAEPFQFKVYATEKGVFCDVVRPNGKQTDVRLLSGAESESFRLLFMLSLLLLIPSDRRTNFVVLDEPDSHMDEHTLTLFIERFIPFLREIVPHVFLITPKDTDKFDDAERWTIVKEDGVSTLHRKSIREI